MIWAIGDLHLSFYHPKPMDIFGENWHDHHIKIKNNWNNKVNDDDTVLLAGDTSWAMTIKEFEPDLEFIHNLKGKKIIVTGNHDYWWGSTDKLNGLYDDIFFLKNNSIRVDDIHICGTRGWICPNDNFFTEHDYKIYNREVNRLKFSLDNAFYNGAKKIIVLLHYPPFNDKKEKSHFIDLMDKYPIYSIIYGHLHGDFCSYKIEGKHFGKKFYLVSSDYINFDPIEII